MCICIESLSFCYLLFVILRLLKFSESSYTAFPHIKHMEEHGKRGDRILMKGLQTGGAIVSVKPVDPVYRVSSPTLKHPRDGKNLPLLVLKPFGSVYNEVEPFASIVM